MRTCVMVSGTGSILNAMIEADVPIDLVIADQPCSGLEIAEAADISTEIIRRDDFGFVPGLGDKWEGRQPFTESIEVFLEIYDIDLVAMAGFETVLAPCIFENYGGWILNIHPAGDIARFPGFRAVQLQLEAGVSQAGTTIHIATEIIDDPRFVVATAQVPVLPGDTKETLHERIKEQERILYPETLKRIQSGDLNLAAIRAAV